MKRKLLNENGDMHVKNTIYYFFVAGRLLQKLTSSYLDDDKTEFVATLTAALKFVNDPEMAAVLRGEQEEATDA